MINLTQGKYFGKRNEFVETDHFIFNITNHDPNLQICNHYHDNPYLSVLLKGKYAELSKKNENLVTPGDILFRPAAYSHKNKFNEESGKCFNVEFKEQSKQSKELSKQIPEKFSIYQSNTHKSIYQLIVSFKASLNPDGLEEYMFHWLSELNHCSNNLHSYAINKSIKILDSEVDHFHRLNDLAERVCIHPVYLSRLFKEKTGKTISEYQLQNKIQHAAKMLLNTKFSISRVSQELAFFDDAHFIRSFKSILGLSPHQFRLKLKS